MKVRDPGHLYELTNLDAREAGERTQTLCFVKRIGGQYPGNVGLPYAGTITQEVIRALIDRTQYVNRQRPDRRNETVIAALRQALRALEMRAAGERKDFSALIKIAGMDEPETDPTCERCGHVMCRREHGGGR